MSTWAERHCDENNWYQEEAVVLADGRALSMATPGDYRGRDWLGNEFIGMPQETRWERARLFAMQCVATDFELGGRPSIGLPLGEPAPDPEYWSSFEQLRDRIIEEVPPRLAALWAKGSLLHTGGAGGFSLDNYVRTKWSRQFSMFTSSMDYGRDCAPFCGHGTPYDYRAFDLTNEGDDYPRAILFVDIHT